MILNVGGTLSLGKGERELSARIHLCFLIVNKHNLTSHLTIPSL